MRYYVYVIAVIISVVLAVVGGIVFRFLEVDNESKIAEKAHAQLQEFLESRPCLQMSDIAWLEHAIGDTKTGGIRILPNAPATLENITNWDMQSTIFLALQVMGSVGYGNAPPMTSWGRLFCVLYGLFGLPLFVVAAYGIGDRLFHGMDRLRVRIYERLLHREAPPRRTNSALAITLGLLTLIGFILFILTAAAIFHSLEDWTFGEALYCCFITVLTIGYADFVPGEKSPSAYRTWYRLAVGAWIMVALLWFGGIFTAVRKLLKYDEIHQPFRLDGEENDDQRQTSVRKNWRKHFDHQWGNKLRGRRRAHQQLHNPAARPSQEALDARQYATQFDPAVPVFARNRPAAESVVYDATGGSRINCSGPASTSGTHVSRVEITS